MSGKNRYLKGDINPIIAPVHSYHTVEAGDFMVINKVAGMCGVGQTADNYAFPFSEVKTAGGAGGSGTLASQGFIYTYFLGVAMEDSPSGVTENITVATSGVFRHPLHSSLVGAVTIGALVSAVSNNLAAGVSPQVLCHGAAGAITSTAYLGYIMKTESGASFVDFQLRTAFGPGGVAS